MNLSEEQLKIIRTVVEQSNIRIQTLGEDLIDHLCCAVEQRMEISKDFEAALKGALADLAPQGLNNIEQETVYLLNFNKNTHMKKLMYFVGLLTAMSMSMGFMFRIFQWRGGLALLNYGIYGFVFFFVPMVTIHYFKTHPNHSISDKLRNVLGLLSGVIAGSGIAMKFSGITRADELILIGALLFSFFFLPLLFFNLYKKAVA